MSAKSPRVLHDRAKMSDYPTGICPRRHSSYKLGEVQQVPLFTCCRHLHTGSPIPKSGCGWVGCLSFSPTLYMQIIGVGKGA